MQRPVLARGPFWLGAILSFVAMVATGSSAAAEPTAVFEAPVPAVDTDGDGIDDADDNCPEIPNPDQIDAFRPNGIGDRCEDFDADTVADLLDNCPHNANELQGDMDADGVGDACDLCPEVHNPDQSHLAGCVEADAEDSSCVDLSVDLADGALTGLRVYEIDSVRPEAISVELCGALDELEIYLNGSRVGSFGEVAYPGGDCLDPAVLRIEDPAVLDGIWKVGASNRVGFRGGSPDSLGLVAWIRLKVETPHGSDQHCLFDVVGNGSCANENQFVGTLVTLIQREISVAPTLDQELLLQEQPFADDLARIDLSGAEDGLVRVCADSERDLLYASTGLGELVAIDPARVAVEHVSFFPATVTSIDYDHHTKRGVAKLSGAGYRPFDLRTGQFTGPRIDADRSLDVLRFVDGELVGASGVFVYDVDFDSGISAFSTAVSPFGISRLAHDDASGTTYALSTGFGSTLLRLDLTDGSREVVGELGFLPRTLEVGSDGFLYGSLGAQPVAGLFRIHPETAQPELLPQTVQARHWTGLTRVQDAPLARCAVFEKSGQQTITINGATCDLLHSELGGDDRLECENRDATTLVLDGSPSRAGLAPREIVLYEWFLDYGGPTELALGQGELLELPMPVGSYDVTLRVTDDQGQTDLAEKSYTIADTDPPRLELPDVVLQCTTPGGAIAQLGPVDASDACCDEDPIVSNDAPDFFPLGLTEVHWTAEDCEGNTTETTQYVQVVDPEWFFSTELNEWAGPRRLRHHFLHHSTQCADPIASVAAGFLPPSLGLDAADVLEDGDVLFSVDSNRSVWINGQSIRFDQAKIYRYDLQTGAVSTSISFDDWIFPPESIDALAALPDGGFAFSVESSHWVRYVGTPVLARPNSVYVVDPRIGEIARVLDGDALGLDGLDAVDLLADGRILFSSERNTNFPTSVRQENAYAYDVRSGSVYLVFNGAAKGLDTLDAFAMGLPPAPEIPRDDRP